MDPAERLRYSRQILFPGIGETGQEALLASHAVVVGCGALGSFHAAALARAGVGRITIIDRDYVEPSNLHRQWLFEECDAAEALPKAVAAQRRIASLNSAIRVRGVIADLTAENVAELLGDAGVILDGTDNFETRYLINDFAVSRGIPWIYGAAVGSYGLAMPVIPGRTACLRCVYPEPPSGAQPTCETAGVLNVIISAVASLQVADALKILSGNVDLVQAANHHHGSLVGRHPANPKPGARPRLSHLRASRVSLSGAVRTSAGGALRPQCGANPPGGARGGSGRIARAPGAVGRSASQRIRGALPIGRHSR